MPEDDGVRRPDPEIAALAAAMRVRLDELAGQLGERIRGAVEVYRTDAVVPFDDLRSSCRNHLEFLLGQLIDAAPMDLGVPRSIGRRRADQGVPLAALMDAYRIGSRFIWETVVDHAQRSGHGADQALVRAASDLWVLTDAYTAAMMTAYRDAVSAQLLHRDHERSAFVEALLSDQLTDTTTLWDAANALQLPYRGLFVVVAAEVPSLARETLPDIESLLAAQAIGSVWRLSPDLKLGVASLRENALLDRLVAVLRAAASRRVGISPAYTNLTDTPGALRFARIALASAPEGSNQVTSFDDAPLSVVVASAPETAARLARIILGTLLELPDDDRDVLMHTLTTWFASHGSATETAQKLYCHPNTVRHRLHRIEQQTGRPLDDPNAVSELRLALETLRWVPESGT